ncbi:MAG TPA: radical SAM protein [Planctomycetota bacterium]|nr:radical SAM protein [Planctomycetota bacterium]
MNCNAIDSLYLKANGELPCWCSPGESFPILRLDAAALAGWDIVRDVLDGPAFRTMRRELYHGRMPFPYCAGCSFLRDDGEAAWGRIDTQSFRLRAVDTVQVESSFLCNVDCPLCVRLDVRKQVKTPPYQLAPELFRKVVDDLVAAGIGVREFWFSGRGEPLLNPGFALMARYARDRLGSRVTCHTNGNLRFDARLLEAGLDEIEIAFDGVDQESYARYRRGGRLEVVERFARDFAAARRAAGRTSPELVWKMILFEWNSSDAELERAVARAHELGLDRVLLVDTDTPGGISYRDGGKRRRELDPLVARLAQRHADLKVELLGYHSVYSLMPEVEVRLRLDAEPGRRVVLGRLFNHLLESRRVRVTCDLESGSGQPAHRLVDQTVELAERTELVDSFAVSTDALPADDYRVHIAVSDPTTGRLLSEGSADFAVGAVELE